MEAAALMNDLRRRGIRLSLEDETVWVEPASRLTDEDEQAIRSLKPELVRLLRTDVLPIIALEEIGKIIDGLEAQFPGLKWRGWLPDPDRIIPEQLVTAELMRVLPDLNRHAWPKEARQRLLARIQPGDRIVKVTDDFLLVSATPPREGYRVWRNDA
jgi:hypothetical protein